MRICNLACVFHYAIEKNEIKSEIIDSVPLRSKIILLKLKTSFINQPVGKLFNLFKTRKLCKLALPHPNDNKLNMNLFFAPKLCRLAPNESKLYNVLDPTRGKI